MKHRILPKAMAVLVSLSLPATAQLNSGLQSYWSFDTDLADAGPLSMAGTLRGTDGTLDTFKVLLIALSDRPPVAFMKALQPVVIVRNVEHAR